MPQSLTALYLQNPELANALRKRQEAGALAQAGADYSPIQSPWQGLSRLAQALVGGYEQGQADKEIKAQGEKQKELLSGLMAPMPGMGAPMPQAQPDTPQQPMTAPQPVRSQFLPPPGVDPDEDLLVRTVYGEARGEPAQGQQGVAAVVRNRAKAAGVPISSVVFAPGQFEPWNNPQTRAQLERLDPASPEYQKILQNIRAGGDPTGGATHFYSPQAQAALGRPAPAWATGTPTQIGGHNFYNLPYSYRGPAPAQGGETIPAQMPGQPAQGGAPQPRTPDAAQFYMGQAQEYQRRAQAAIAAGRTDLAGIFQQQAQMAQQMALARAPQPKTPIQVVDPTDPSGRRLIWIDPDRAVGMQAPPKEPLVNIDQKQEGTYGQERGKTYAARATGWEDAETKGRERLRTVDRFKTALDGIETGFGSQTQITLGQIAKKLGVPEATVNAAGLDVNSTAKREEIRAYAGKLLLESLGGAGGFPTQGFSNADRDFIMSVLPGLLNSTAGNKALLALIETGAKRDVAISRAWREWRRENGDSPDSVRRFEDEKMPGLQGADGEAQRILEDSGWKDTNPTSGPGAPQEGATATNPQTGERVMFRGGQWVPAQ